MPVTLPHALTDGTTAYGSQARANDDALASKFTEGSGGIADPDISSAAAIKGTKLSSVAGNRIPFDRIEDDAVTVDKLRDDATTDANRAVTTNHIRDLAVTKGKVASSTLTHGQLDMIIQATAFSSSPGFSVNSVSATLGVVGANYVIILLMGGGVGSAAVATVTPSPAIPTATRSPIAVYLRTVTTFGTGTIGGNAYISHIAVS